MVALQIRDVPEDVRSVLARKAERQGQSLQAYLLRLVTQDADRERNRALLQRFEGRSDGVGAADSGAVLEALDAARAERDNSLMNSYDATDEGRPA